MNRKKIIAEILGLIGYILFAAAMLYTVYLKYRYIR